MSHAGVILGISELEVERVDRDRGIKVYARPTRRQPCIRCHHPQVRIKATRQRTVKHTRQGNQVLTLYLKSPKYHCAQCGRYFFHRFQGVRPRFRASEAFRLEKCSKPTTVASLKARFRAPMTSVRQRWNGGIKVSIGCAALSCRIGPVRGCWGLTNTFSPVGAGTRRASSTCESIGSSMWRSGFRTGIEAVFARLIGHRPCAGGSHGPIRDLP